MVWCGGGCVSVREGMCVSESVCCAHVCELGGWGV